MPAPTVRIDRDFMNALELYITEYTVRETAKVIDALTSAGAIYGQVLLPPEQAQRKQALMQQPEVSDELV